MTLPLKRKCSFVPMEWHVSFQGSTGRFGRQVCFSGNVQNSHALDPRSWLQHPPVSDISHVDSGMIVLIHIEKRILSNLPMQTRVWMSMDEYGGTVFSVAGKQFCPLTEWISLRRNLSDGLNTGRNWKASKLDWSPLLLTRQIVTPSQAWRARCDIFSGRLQEDLGGQTSQKDRI